MQNPEIVIETERLNIRKITPSDSVFILSILNEASFIQNIGDRNIRNLADAENYIEKRFTEVYGKLGFGMYLVELKENGTAIGMCGLVKREILPDVDIGFAFLPEYWNKGYAIESASAVLEFARNVVGLKRLLGITSPDNHSSIRVLERLGLRFDRVVKFSEDGAESKLFAIDFS